MTASSPSSASTPQQTSDNHGKQSATKQHNPTMASMQQQSSTSIQASCPSFNSSAAFQQVKQTQASLARLCRVHHQQQQHQSQHHQQGSSSGSASSAAGTAASQNNQSSQQHLAKLSLDSDQQQQQKPTTFVDCLIRRFKNCFDEDFCTVPMFVVGSLSPGSDGTHLILPPCVSLGGQNINRFSSPKNLRLMNSIRDSCRSIEELDLGGNKLTDLIEVYKILQCTPNLRFLNLSENDLSRTSPVAMASFSYPSTATATAASSSSISSGSIISGSGLVSSLTATSTGGSTGQQSVPSAVTLSQRACLAPINQNHQLHPITNSIGTRRHSTLGQTSSSLSTTTTSASTRPLSESSQAAPIPVHLRARQTISRVAEARRLAAANALAQSKKTSSNVASKLASSANLTSGSLSRQASGSCRTIVARADDASASIGVGKQTKILASQRQKSTMHLARSLSSLSAKDIRVATSASSIGRLTGQRSSSRNEFSSRALPGGANNNRRSSIGSAAASGNTGAICGQQKQQQQQPLVSSASQIKEMAESGGRTKITTSTSHQKLYAEPIVENEDVDMSGEQQQQLSPSGQNLSHQASCNQASTVSSAGSSSGSSNINHNQHQQMRASQAGNTLRSYCNNNTNNSLLTIGNNTNNQSTNFRRTFESVKALALNNTGCQWKVVCSILSRMPNLEELHLSLNNYEKIDLDTNEFKHLSLKRLYLCNNPKLTNWEELDKLLIAFPSLEALSIADCNISQIPDNLDRAREWRKLCGLNINGWPIKEWPIIERLNQLPSLIDLRCRNLEVLNTIDEPRHHLIARLPKLQRLNGSEIEEREDAEKAFLRFFMVNSHLERPSRFHELMQIYGEVPHIDVDVDLSPPSQANVRIIYLNRNHYRKADEDDVLMSEDFLLKLMDNINANEIAASKDSTTTTSNDDGNCQTQENMDVAEVPNPPPLPPPLPPPPSSSSSSSSSPSTKNTSTETQLDSNNRPIRLFKDEGQEVVALDVDLRQSVRKFKSTIASLFGLDSQNLIIYYIDHEMVGLMGPELIKHNQKKLWNYNVQDGDQFIVEDR